MTDIGIQKWEGGIQNFFLFSHPQPDVFFFRLPHLRRAIVPPYRTTAGLTSEFFYKLYALCPMLNALFARNP
jgi:hypothetical protein